VRPSVGIYRLRHGRRPHTSGFNVIVLLAVSLSVCLSVCLSVRPSVCLSVCADAAPRACQPCALVWQCFCCIAAPRKAVPSLLPALGMGRWLGTEVRSPRRGLKFGGSCGDINDTPTSPREMNSPARWRTATQSPYVLAAEASANKQSPGVQRPSCTRPGWAPRTGLNPWGSVGGASSAWVSPRALPFPRLLGFCSNAQRGMALRKSTGRSRLPTPPTGCTERRSSFGAPPVERGVLLSLPGRCSRCALADPLACSMPTP